MCLYAKILFLSDYTKHSLCVPTKTLVRAGLACRLGQCFCLRQRSPPETRTPKTLERKTG